MARSRGRVHAAPPEPVAVPPSGVLAIYGYGVQVQVQDGHLVVSYLDGERRRSARFNRATCGLKRLVVLGPTGSLSLDALRWLHDVGVGLVVVGRNAELLTVQGAGQLDHVRLRRAQALAPVTAAGLEIMRGLLREKFNGQLRILARLGASGAVRAGVERARADLDEVLFADELMRLEGAVADLYWQAWEELPVRFPRTAAGLPEHWHHFGVRKSPVGRMGSPNQAITPGNALTNFLYALLETEARLAAVALDLDPSQGILHVDHRYRDSLALDLMEPVRPAVDAYLLELLDTTTFRLRDFIETREGVCRITPRLTTALARTLPRWRALVAPVAERTAQALADLGSRLAGEEGLERLPTPLTGERRGRKRARLPVLPVIPSGCRECGADLAETGRHYCDDCLPKHQVGYLPAAGLASLTASRQRGVDPSHGGQAAVKRARAMARHNRLARQWKGKRREPDVFLREVLPGLKTVRLMAMVRATGLSRTYCETIRRGVRVPHPRHWPALRELVSQ